MRWKRLHYSFIQMQYNDLRNYPFFFFIYYESKLKKNLKQFQILSSLNNEKNSFIINTSPGNLIQNDKIENKLNKNIIIFFSFI